MENKMAEVAKLLGVKLGDEFNIKSSSFIYKLTERGLQSKYKIEGKWYPSGMLEDLLEGNYTIIQHTRPILNEDEKKHLSALIYPFRYRILAIAKVCDDLGERIEIYHKHYLGVDYGEVITLPYFKPGTMYKGMKAYKGYTVDDLGL